MNVVFPTKIAFWVNGRRAVPVGEEVQILPLRARFPPPGKVVPDGVFAHASGLVLPRYLHGFDSVGVFGFVPAFDSVDGCDDVGDIFRVICSRRTATDGTEEGSPIDGRSPELPNAGPTCNPFAS